jgi:VCBS repeat-containing protein
LSWTDQSNNESGFEIEQATDGQSFVPIGTAAANATGAEISGLQAETAYWYQVRAVNGAGKSAYAGPVSATTPAAPPPNEPPVADSQEVETAEDTAVAIILEATDPDDGPAALTFAVDAGPAHGALGPVAGDVVAYTPEEDYYGEDVFTFHAFDGEDSSAPAAVTITILPVNDAPVAADDAAVTLEGMAVSIPVLGNDTDVDADLLSVSAVFPAENGSVSIDPGGASVTYRPNPGFSGTDTFTYDVTDNIDVATALVVVTVERAVLFYDGFESGGLVAGGWTDVQSIAEVITGAAHDGTYGLQIKKTGSLTKVLNTGGALTIQLRYWRRTSGLAASEYLQVEIAQDGGPWSVIDQVSGASNWIQLTHDLDLQDGVSTVSLRFRLGGNGGNDVAYLDEIEVTGGTPNSPPVAVADTYEVSEDGTLTVDAASGVLANDTDAEGNLLNAALVAGPANGNLTLSTDGSFIYTPAADFSGADSFTYTATDGQADSEQATVAITVTAVNDAPVAVDDSATTSQDNSVLVAVLANDTDVDGNPLTVTIVSGPANGAAVEADGSITYTPNPGFTGTDSFTYTASDGSLADEAQVTIDVTRVNSSPVAAVDGYTVDEDNVLTVAGPGVLGNDTDADGDALAAVLVAGPSNGNLTLIADGSFSYSPAADFHGTDSFTYTANDGLAASAPATVTITVAAVNDAPVAADDSVTTDEDTSTAGNVLANDTDLDGDALTASLLSGPSNGSLTLNTDGSFTYTPAVGFTGTDGFTYTVSDGQGGTATAAVTITVNPVASTSDMIISGIAMDLISAGKNWKASATISVTAQDQPVPNATVTAEWYLRDAPLGSASSGVTDGQGTVILVSVPEKAKVGDTFLIRITDVTADGYEYSAEGSVTTEATITVP